MSGLGLLAWGSVTAFFLLCGVVSPTPNPQPGGPGLRIDDPRRRWLSSTPGHWVPRVPRGCHTPYPPLWVPEGRYVLISDFKMAEAYIMTVFQTSSSCFVKVRYSEVKFKSYYVGVKLLSSRRKSTDWGCLRTMGWVEYFDLRQKTWKETGKTEQGGGGS
jgi:hypothetical protein